MRPGDRRANRILSRAEAMFSAHGDPETARFKPGSYNEPDEQARVTVTLTVEAEEETWRIGIVDRRGRALFAATRESSGRAVVTVWEGGRWERLFIATDA